MSAMRFPCWRPPPPLVFARHAWSRDRRAFAGLVLLAAIVLSFAVAVGTNGPFDGLPIRAMRACVPRFRMIRQPLKVLCLMPTLLAALFGLGFAILRRRTRTRNGAWPWIAASAAAAVVAFDARLGTVVGVCRLPGENAAYAAAAAAARARGEVPRALVLPIFRGDAYLNAPYLYWARASRLRMLNGYAATWSRDYEDTVAKRYRTMEEGDFSDDQIAGLRACGVTSVLVHESLLARLRLPFPGGATLRRLLANPHLEFLAADRGVWAFAFLPDGGRGNGAPSAPDVETASFHCRPAGKSKRTADWKIRLAADVCSEGHGFLVRAAAKSKVKIAVGISGSNGGEADATTVFPAVPDAAPGDFRLCFVPVGRPGPDRTVRCRTRGKARVTDVAFAAASATNGFRRICFADLQHRWGETFFGDDGQPAGVRFVPGRAPACHTVSGPFLPPAPDMRRVRLAEFDASRILPDGVDAGPPESIVLVRPDKKRVALRVGDELPGDGTEPVSFDVAFDPADGVTLELRSLLLEDAS